MSNKSRQSKRSIAKEKPIDTLTPVLTPTHTFTETVAKIKTDTLADLMATDSGRVPEREYGHQLRKSYVNVVITTPAGLRAPKDLKPVKLVAIKPLQATFKAGSRKNCVGRRSGNRFKTAAAQHGQGTGVSETEVGPTASRRENMDFKQQLGQIYSLLGSVHRNNREDPEDEEVELADARADIVFNPPLRNVYDEEEPQEKMIKGVDSGFKSGYEIIDSAERLYAPFSRFTRVDSPNELETVNEVSAKDARKARKLARRKLRVFADDLEGLKANNDAASKIVKDSVKEISTNVDTINTDPEAIRGFVKDVSANVKNSSMEIPGETTPKDNIIVKESDIKSSYEEFVQETTETYTKKETAKDSDNKASEKTTEGDISNDVIEQTAKNADIKKSENTFIEAFIEGVTENSDAKIFTEESAETTGNTAIKEIIENSSIREVITKDASAINEFETKQKGIVIEVNEVAMGISTSVAGAVKGSEKKFRKLSDSKKKSTVSISPSSATDDTFLKCNDPEENKKPLSAKQLRKVRKLGHLKAEEKSQEFEVTKEVDFPKAVKATKPGDSANVSKDAYAAVPMVSKYPKATNISKVDTILEVVDDLTNFKALKTSKVFESEIPKEPVVSKVANIFKDVDVSESADASTEVVTNGIIEDEVTQKATGVENPKLKKVIVVAAANNSKPMHVLSVKAKKKLRKLVNTKTRGAAPIGQGSNSIGVHVAELNAEEQDCSNQTVEVDKQCDTKEVSQIRAESLLMADPVKAKKDDKPMPEEEDWKQEGLTRFYRTHVTYVDWLARQDNPKPPGLGVSGFGLELREYIKPNGEGPTFIEAKATAPWPEQYKPRPLKVMAKRSNVNADVSPPSKVEPVPASKAPIIEGKPLETFPKFRIEDYADDPILEKRQWSEMIIGPDDSLLQYDYTPESMSRLLSTLQAENPGIRLMGWPYPGNVYGDVNSFIITVNSTPVANRLMTTGIRHNGALLLTRFLHCHKCNEYGHNEARCDRHVVCLLCGHNHHYRTHDCSHCKVTGMCIHSRVVVCLSCDHSHSVSLDEVFYAQKLKVEGRSGKTKAEIAKIDEWNEKIEVSKRAWKNTREGKWFMHETKAGRPPVVRVCKVCFTKETHTKGACPLKSQKDKICRCETCGHVSHFDDKKLVTPIIDKKMEAVFAKFEAEALAAEMREAELSPIQMKKTLNSPRPTQSKKVSPVKLKPKTSAVQKPKNTIKFVPIKVSATQTKTDSPVIKEDDPFPALQNMVTAVQESNDLWPVLQKVPAPVHKWPMAQKKESPAFPAEEWCAWGGKKVTNAPPLRM